MPNKKCSDLTKQHSPALRLARDWTTHGGVSLPRANNRAMKNEWKGRNMLSDTLFEALCEIERYEKDFPQCYADSAEEIRKVTLEMRMLQLRFDMVPRRWTNVPTRTSIG